MDENREELVENTKGVVKPEDEVALTSAEAELILSQKRDRFYKQAMAATLIFCVISVALMAGFKFNEEFFDANSRLSLLMEGVNKREENLSYPKINVRADFKDEKISKLVIKPDTQIAAGNVSVREEFTKNKIVITLADASENIEDGIELVTDSTIMDAVGIYRQNRDVIVEVYCNDTYSWSLDNQENAIIVTFGDLSREYSGTVVVYMPYEDKNRLVIPEWQQSLSKFAADNDIKLFLAYNMQESYTQQEVVDFANRIEADMMLGIEVRSSADAAEINGVTVCNTMYFVPDFNSAQLAITMAEAFAEETNVVPYGFRECEEKDVLVSQSVIPAAMMEISLPQTEAERVETVYKLNESILSAIKKTIAEVFEIYIIS